MADVVAVGVAPAAAPDASAPASAAAPKKKGFTLRLRGRSASPDRSGAVAAADDASPTRGRTFFKSFAGRRTKSGSPAKRSSPKKAGFLSRTFRFGGGKGGVGATMRDLGASVRGGLQAAVEVLKESDQVVVVQAWDGTEHGVDVLKPCKVHVLRAKVVHMVKRADGVDDAAADPKAPPQRYVLLFRGATLEDGDAVPDAAFKPVGLDDVVGLPSEIWISKSDYVPTRDTPDDAGPAGPRNENAWDGLGAAPSSAPLDYDDPSLADEADSASDSSGEDDFEFVGQAKARRRVSNLAGQQAVRRKSSVAAREHPQSEKFHLRRELALLHCGDVADRLEAAGYDDRGAFGNLTEEILRATPLFVNRRTSRKIVALAEIYKQQDARDAAAPTTVLGNMDKAEAEDTAAFTAGDDVFFGKRSDVRKFFGSRKAGGSVAGDASTLGSRGATTRGGDFDDESSVATIVSEARSEATATSRSSHGSSLSSLTTRKRKEKRTVNPLFAHVGRIGKGVPDLPGEDPSLQERLDALLQPVGAGLRGQQTETIRAVELVLGDVFAKDKFRDEYLEAMIEANSGNSVPSAVTAVKRRATALDGVGVSIRLKRPEDRAMAVHKLATKLYENVIAKRRPRAFSPTYPELQDFLFRLLGRDAVVERNGQAVRDRSELERAHRALSKSVVDDAATKIHSKDDISMDDRARELMSEGESQAALGGHLRSDASSPHSERARAPGDGSLPATRLAREAAADLRRIAEERHAVFLDLDAKALKREVELVLAAAEAPVAEGDVFYAAEYEPHRLAGNCGYAAAKRVLAQANNDEQETVFEVLRRRDAVLPELAPLDDGLTPVSSADLVAFRDAHMDAVRRYVAFRDEWRKAELPEEESTKRSSGEKNRPVSSIMDIDPDELKKLVGSMETTGDDDDDDDDGSFATDRGDAQRALAQVRVHRVDARGLEPAVAEPAPGAQGLRPVTPPNAFPSTTRDAA
ncbi:hypothetical protein JL720_3593 [Aureococcus anophagefferens]|nr:hypothetical protein JL720_3593 [Aureococcus anophagefferens]